MKKKLIILFILLYSSLVFAKTKEEIKFVYPQRISLSSYDNCLNNIMRYCENNNTICFNVENGTLATINIDTHEVIIYEVSKWTTLIAKEN